MEHVRTALEPAAISDAGPPTVPFVPPLYVVPLGPDIMMTTISQDVTANEAVLLFTTVKAQTPVDREHETCSVKTSPSNGMIKFPSVVAALGALGKATVATAPSPRARITAARIARLASFLYSDTSGRYLLESIPLVG